MRFRRASTVTKAIFNLKQGKVNSSGQTHSALRNFLTVDSFAIRRRRQWRLQLYWALGHACPLDFQQFHF